jgi:Histidine kinase-, DNA gyrase B-, and HSP90-like ATPase
VLVPWDVVFSRVRGAAYRALDNVLDNAVRYGAPPFTLRGDVRDDTLRIRVSDAGPGVPADLAQQLFQRFSNAGPSAGTGPGSTWSGRSPAGMAARRSTGRRPTGSPRREAPAAAARVGTLPLAGPQSSIATAK